MSTEFLITLCTVSTLSVVCTVRICETLITLVGRGRLKHFIATRNGLEIEAYPLPMVDTSPKRLKQAVCAIVTDHEK